MSKTVFKDDEVIQVDADGSETEKPSDADFQLAEDEIAPTPGILQNLFHPTEKVRFQHPTEEDKYVRLLDRKSTLR